MQLLGNEMQHLPFPLYPPSDTEQLPTEQRPAVTFRDVRPYDQIQIARLVFQRDEDDTRSTRRTLTRDHDSSRMHTRAGAKTVHIGGSDHRELLEPRAQKRERVTFQRKPKLAVVGDDILPFRRAI